MKRKRVASGPRFPPSPVCMTQGETIKELIAVEGCLSV